MKKAVRNFRKLLICCLCAAVLISSLPMSVFAADDTINVWTENNLVKVLPINTRTSDSGDSVNIVMAKNEYEAGQIILKSETGFNINSVEFTDLTGTSGTLTKDNLKFNFVDYMQLYTNSVSWWHETEYLDKGYTDNIFPEKLLNDATRSVAANIAQSIWITAYTPKSTAAGTYSGNVTVKTDRGDFTVPLSLQVYDVTVPDPADGEYKNMAWTATAGYTGVDQYVVEDGPNKGAVADPVLAYYPNVTKYSTQWWDLMGEFCKSMRENRVSNYWVPTMHLLIDGGTTVDADGTVNFNWSKFDEVIDFFLKNGSFNVLEGSHFLYGGGTGAGTYTVAGLKRDENGNTVRCNIPFDDSYTEKFAKQFFKALDEHIKSKETNGIKWSDLWTQYLGDEPSTDTMTAQWIKTYDEWLHPNAPDMRTHVAVNTMDKVIALEGRVNMWVPILNMEDTNIDFFRDRRDNHGEQFINYICGGNPCQTYPNRHIDIPYAPLRMLGWYNFEMGIPGTLSWAYNFWWQDNATAKDMPGDDGIVYPDPDNNKLISTVRAAQLRDGIEEYELFRILQKQNKFPGLADKIVKSIVKSGLDYSIDPNAIMAARTDLIKAAAGEDVTYKYADEHQYANTFKTNSITVDGKLDERAWFNTVSAAKPVAGSAATIAADFGTSWDEQNLYIGLKVSDPTGAKTDFTKDSMIFFVSPTNNRTLTYAPGDFQIKVSDKGATIETGAAGVGNNANIDLKQIKVASDYSDKGYTMEIAVPWTQIGITPSVDTHIGFDLMAVDGNENGGTVVWSGNENDPVNPQNFGELTLKSEDTTQVADSNRTAQISLDGVLNDSCWSDPTPLNKVVDGSSDKISSQFQTAWDKQNMYIGVKVNDPSGVKTDFTQDSISLYFAPKNFRGTPYSRDDFQLQISDMGKTVEPGAANVGKKRLCKYKCGKCQIKLYISGIHYGNCYPME
ncbi:MAG TPA: sugar-binding protein [Ruminiclostridium sp.]|nr:sugar-binding protein [Ruminiclostridium sp.]